MSGFRAHHPDREVMAVLAAAVDAVARDGRAADSLDILQSLLQTVAGAKLLTAARFDRVQVSAALSATSRADRDEAYPGLGQDPKLVVEEAVRPAPMDLDQLWRALTSPKCLASRVLGGLERA